MVQILVNPDTANTEHDGFCSEFAAAGNHQLLMIGPPGSGKTMLARRIATILTESHQDQNHVSVQR